MLSVSWRIREQWLSIDPGLGGTGFAIWRGDKLITSGSHSCKDGAWDQKIKVIVDLFSSCFGLPCYYELPFIAMQGKAIISAKTQDVIKLTMIAGAIANAFNLSYPVPVIQWKGQLSKTNVKRRVMRYLNSINYKPRTRTSHEIDAIGIGMYVIEKGGDVDAK